MTFLDVIEVPSGEEVRRIELHQGDLADLEPKDAVDLLIISAFPNDYSPTPTSLIGALYRRGVNVHELATCKAIDVLDTHACWLSQPIVTDASGIQFDRVLCFEPQLRGEAPELVGDIFRALAPFVAKDPPMRTAAMPIVAAGDQGHSVESMLSSLVDAAVHWMRIGLPLETLKIFAFEDSTTSEAVPLFAKLKREVGSSCLDETKLKYDVFVSYSRDNADAAEKIREVLEPKGLRLFVDNQELERGAAWQQRIFEALDACSRLIAVYSPSYISSKVCQEEFNIAWARSRKMDVNIIYPIYWVTTRLPTYMEMLNFIDCREARKQKLQVACDNLANSLDR